MAPPKVILTNDDGPESPFFNAWVAHVRQKLKWNAVVCIPSTGQSFVSKSITRSPFQVHEQSPDNWHIDASPATCANLAIYDLVPDATLVLSGPNVGHNVGRGSVLSSGTVGAAMEAAIAGRRGIAISFPFFHGFGNWTETEILKAVEAAGAVTEQLVQSWGDDVDIYNVNVPVQLAKDYQVSFTTVDPTSQYHSLYGLNEENGCYEWSPKGLRVFEVDQALPGSDVAAIKLGHVSVTPLKAGFVPAQHPIHQSVP
eukprot:CAMPEP_0206135278 /NCGR_PEP_ID=MMETSP1473-20131121/600_1 /ASSEMBLY_ACC=CAM_ASM_001109 /TAXON_ID=1461547 /ORGANISM="Stichococcus sp, Strain RCC1054" /LENGTH=255 /DNA_ID=CAMNT_0053527079 /DNA_START=302 /DNA_END=1069 /DNA_ORIENTATION=+